MTCFNKLLHLMGNSLTKVGMHILIGNFILRTIKKIKNKINLKHIMRLIPLQIFLIHFYEKFLSTQLHFALSNITLHCWPSTCISRHHPSLLAFILHCQSSLAILRIHIFFTILTSLLWCVDNHVIFFAMMCSTTIW